jgi:hypothetical protein
MGMKKGPKGRRAYCGEGNSHPFSFDEVLVKYLLGKI